MSNNLINKVSERTTKPANPNLKDKENIGLIDKPNKQKTANSKNRILSGTKLKELGTKKLSKIASQPIFKKYKARKASYLGNGKTTLQHREAKSKKKPIINNQKAISKLFKLEKRDSSASTSTFQVEKRPLSKAGKPKTSLPLKFASRNSENPTGAEACLVNSRSFAQHMLSFNQPRQSADVTQKLLNSTTVNEIVTPRNKKLFKKVSLLRKLPSESNERGQSSNYRRVRIGRLVDRKDSNTTVTLEKKNKPKVLKSINRSNSVNSQTCKNDLLNSSKLNDTNILKINLCEQLGSGKSLTREDTLHSARLCPSSATLNKALTSLNPLKESNTNGEENFTFTDESGIPNKIYTRRQRRVGCINKIDVLNYSGSVQMGKYKSHYNKENYTQKQV